jgi:hypothetical protein
MSKGEKLLVYAALVLLFGDLVGAALVSTVAVGETAVGGLEASVAGIVAAL